MTDNERLALLCAFAAGFLTMAALVWLFRVVP